MSVTPKFLRKLVEEAKQKDLEVQEDFVEEAIKCLDAELELAAMNGEIAYHCEPKILVLTSRNVKTVDEIKKGSLEKIKQHYKDLGFYVWSGYLGFYIGWD